MKDNNNNNSNSNKKLKICLLDKILGHYKCLEHESIEQNFINTMCEQNNKLCSKIKNIVICTKLSQNLTCEQIKKIIENVDKRVDNININITKNNLGFKINIDFNVKVNNTHGYITFNTN